MSLFGKAKAPHLIAADVAPARTYIAEFWQQLYRHHTKDEDSRIGLPHPYLVPAYEVQSSFDFDEQYYWDTYFMVQGLLTAEHKDLVMGMLDNLCYLYKRFGIIPNASRVYLLSRSQPPLLTSLIRDIFDAYQLDDKWLKSHMDIAESEYHTVWMGTKKPHERLVHQGLSRYYDINYLNDLAEAESGWDMTSRFERRALDFLPVDLNAFLYKYEADFAWTARKFGDEKAAKKWDEAAAARKDTMNRLMWSQARGLFYDYDYTKQKRGGVASLAAYVPLWAGMVTDEQAAYLAKNLKRFEKTGGLVTTDTAPLSPLIPGGRPIQWAYPNGWAPLQYLAIKGLERYGYHENARRLTLKWLRCNLDWFVGHGLFLEKYNVVAPDKPPARGVYPSQTGFGWTNAVFERLCRDYIDQ